MRTGLIRNQEKAKHSPNKVTPLPHHTQQQIFCNAQMSARDFKRFCKVDTAAERLLETAMTKLGLSARAYTRILKVSRTIADLDGLPEITAAQVAEAIQYRSLDRSFH